MFYIFCNSSVWLCRDAVVYGRVLTWNYVDDRRLNPILKRLQKNMVRISNVIRLSPFGSISSFGKRIFGNENWNSYAAPRLTTSSQVPCSLPSIGQFVSSRNDQYHDRWIQSPRPCNVMEDTPCIR
ncbi:uncharacterized protein LOC117230914 [Bombus vosnesenskii]|uniref:Uncharacterized protein LOC117230914 n=1 Tax=Bombus vosnesenskii TaxID=207650 RepID=A0A6J3JWY0_9HYME|nr:uncharacterized protein LOC117230914 [Bombus vosnesenskii]XP_033344700.1 uncharacterized protein LOC117230914 [Bombus vosnesenskii]